MAALEEKEVEVAAKSLALAEVVGKMSSELLDRVRVAISKLDSEQKLKFAEIFQKEKEKIKTDLK